ncbi:MAG: class I SAM-dependent rRNA methyltransferase [Myxococcales bacterium]|nr:class I SAM-dependent rRNA methyltransferase [Myxococcales bacterium]
MGRLPELVVNGYAEQWVGRGFPWVYPKEVVRGGGRPGEQVSIVDRRGRVLGRGLADRGFLAARVFRHADAPLDALWLAATLERARALRRLVVDEATDGFRLVNAENDGLPGIRVDRWADWAVVTLDSDAMVPLLDDLAQWLVDEEGVSGVALCYRPDPRDERTVPPGRLLHGEPPEAPVVVRERGLRFAVDVLDGPDVGLYADMRQVRALLEPYWAGARVLNLFAYTAAFSVAAAAHGAAHTHSVDLAAPVLERARANFALNELPTDEHLFEAEDTFKALDRLRRRGVRFDRAIVDPPSFSRGKATFSAKKDWPRLVAATARVLDDGGLLVVASNQGELSPKVFDGAISDGLRKAGVAGQLLWAAGQGPDFPASTVFPEGRYLKVRVLRVASPAR